MLLASELLIELLGAVEALVLGLVAGCVSVLELGALLVSLPKVLGLLDWMLPEATWVPLAVLPAVPLTAGPGLALARSALPCVGFELLELLISLEGGFDVDDGGVELDGGGVEVDGVCSVGDVDVAGVWLLTGGVVSVLLPTELPVLWLPVVDGCADVAAPAVPAIPVADCDSLPAVPEVLADGPAEPLVEHLSEIICTLLTVSELLVPEALVVPLALDDALEDALLPLGVPVTAISWPTCLVRSAESPCNCHALPDWSVSVKFSLEPLKQPWIVWLDISLVELCDPELGLVELWAPLLPVLPELCVAVFWSGLLELLDPVDDWATATAAASHSIAVIKTAFLIICNSSTLSLPSDVATCFSQIRGW